MDSIVTARSPILSFFIRHHTESPAWVKSLLSCLYRAYHIGTVQTLGSVWHCKGTSEYKQVVIIVKKQNLDLCWVLVKTYIFPFLSSLTHMNFLASQRCHFWSLGWLPFWFFVLFITICFKPLCNISFIKWRESRMSEEYFMSCWIFPSLELFLPPLLPSTCC